MAYVKPGVNSMALTCHSLLHEGGWLWHFPRARKRFGFGPTFPFAPRLPGQQKRPT